MKKNCTVLLVIMFIFAACKRDLTVCLSNRIEEITRGKFIGSIKVMVNNDVTLTRFFGPLNSDKKSYVLNSFCATHLSEEIKPLHKTIIEKVNDISIRIDFCPTAIYTEDTFKLYKNISRTVIRELGRGCKKKKRTEIIRFGE